MSWERAIQAGELSKCKGPEAGAYGMDIKAPNLEEILKVNLEN